MASATRASERYASFAQNRLTILMGGQVGPRALFAATRRQPLTTRLVDERALTWGRNAALQPHRP